MVVLRAGEPGDRNYLPLATRKGTLIKNERRAEAPPDQILAAIRLWREERPLARLRSATRGYDCMGLVFASRRTSVATDQFSMILREDEYRLVREPDQPDVGDVVVYERRNRVEHVGLVAEVIKGPFSVTINVVSKWGQDPEYVHPIDHVPSWYGQATSFWTDRRPPP